jgi:hypothetical protein
MRLMKSKRFRLGGRVIINESYKGVLSWTMDKCGTLADILPEVNISLYVRRFLDSQSQIGLKIQIFRDIIPV